MPTAMVTGASRGIGYALTEELVRRGWTVRAMCRNPEAAGGLLKIASAGQVSIEALDVESPESIAEVAARSDGPLDLLVNNAGITDDSQSVETMDLAEFGRVMQTNLVAPIALTRALKPALLRSDMARAVVVSSAMGSIAAVKATNHLAYRCSKAAVNLAFTAIAAEWAKDGIIVASLTPGVVATDMTAHMPGDARLITPQQSASGLADVMEGLTPDDAGSFFRYNGERVAW